MTKNEKVIQITANANGVFGLSSSGQLVVFDQEANSWVLKCSSDVLSVNRANVLKMPTEIYVAPSNRYRDIKTDVELETTIPEISLKFKIVFVALVAMAGMVIYFLKN